MKKIMILGASATQVPLIKCAKNIGLKTYVSSIEGNYPGFGLADEKLYINTVDKEAILNVCIKNNIDGICTTGTDVAVKSIGYVNSRMGLNGISEEASELVTDKARMKEAMWKYGVPTSEFKIVYSLEEAVLAANMIGYPVMVKTVDQAASKGITKVLSANELEEAYNNALSWTAKDYIIVEKCIIGEEFGLDGYVDAAGVCTIFLHNKMTYFNGKTNVPVGHSIPFKFNNSSLINTIYHVVEECVKSVKLKSSFFNMDMMLCDDKVYVLEIGGRTGSTCIPDMISKYCGFDYYEKILRNAVGEKINMNFTPKCACAAGFIMPEKSGVVENINIPELDSNGIDIAFDVKAGDNVKKFELGSDRIGQVICTAENLNDAEIKFYNTGKIIAESIVYL